MAIGIGSIPPTTSTRWTTLSRSATTCCGPFSARFCNARRHPKNATVKLKWVAFVGGKRESRRLMGDYVYTMKDASEHREFPDTVVCKRHGMLPREVGEQRIAELRKLIGYEA
jgi:hypothetical protein